MIMPWYSTYKTLHADEEQNSQALLEAETILPWFTWTLKELKNTAINLQLCSWLQWEECSLVAMHNSILKLFSTFTQQNYGQKLVE